MLKVVNTERGIVKNIISLLLFLALCAGIWGAFKPLPSGINYISESYVTNDVRFIYDLTYEKDGKRVKKQDIFNNIYDIIDKAEKYIVVDMFLFNDMYNKTDTFQFEELSKTLTDKLIDRKIKNYDVDIYFITDPINTTYKAHENENLKRLKENGINVTMVNLDKLRNSNPIYSSFYDPYLRFAFTIMFPPYMKNPFSETAPDVRAENYLALLNFKANHRKLIVSEKETLISSANAHDPSANHSNVAIRIGGDFVNQVLAAEKAVAAFSGGEITEEVLDQDVFAKGDFKVQLLTEKGIKKTIIRQINILQPGEHLDIAMFYLSDRSVISAIKNAHKRGVTVRVILDANKDAFGSEKDGTPNRQVAGELASSGIEIRWYKTDGEQFHTKMVVTRTENTIKVVTGSANLTRRNLDNYNLELDVFVEGDINSKFAKEVMNYYDMIFKNVDGIYTLEKEAYLEQDKWRWFTYWIQELTGLCTF